MNYVALVFLLHGGANIFATVTRKEGERVVGLHAEGKLPETVGNHNVDCRTDVLSFSLDGEAVMAVYLQPIAPHQQYAFGGPSPFGGSIMS